MQTNMSSIQKMTRIGLLAALAAILFLIEIPVVAFYKLDVSNVPVLLGTFSMGTGAGLIVLGMKSVIGLLHSSTAGVGELADFIIGAALLIPAGMIYQHNKTRKGAFAGMVVGTAVMTAAGCLTNIYLLIPLYQKVYGMPMESIIAMGTAVVPQVDTVEKLVLFITAPFNVLKGGVLSILTYGLYKRLSPFLHGKEIKTSHTQR